MLLPDLPSLARIVQRDELVDIEELVPQPSVDRLDRAVIREISGLGVVKFDPSAIHPVVQRLRGELRSAVHGSGPTEAPGSLIQHRYRAPA